MREENCVFDFLHKMGEVLRHGVLAIDEKGKIRVFNHFCGLILGVKVQNALERNWREIVPESRLGLPWGMVPRKSEIIIFRLRIKRLG